MSQPVATVVVVTTMRCDRLLPLVRMRLATRAVEAEVRAKAPGFLGAATSLDVRGKRLVSISLWTDTASLRVMGSVGAHIRAVHFAMRHAIITDNGVFAYRGHWSTEVFGITRRADRERPPHGMAT